MGEIFKKAVPTLQMYCFQYPSDFLFFFSAYCGGLWLAACAAMTVMAELLYKYDDKKLFENMLNRGKKSFEQKLWNGLYYNHDCSKTESKSIMADQLCAQWYLKCSGVEDYVVSTIILFFRLFCKYFTCHYNLPSVTFFDRTTSVFRQNST